MWPCGWCCAPGRGEPHSCLPGSRGALGSRSWAGWGDRPWNGSSWGTHPSPAESLPYSSRGIVSRCLHSWKQSGFLWHITVQLITPCTPYHEEPHGGLGSYPPAPLPAGGIVQTKGKVWAGPIREVGPAMRPPGKGVGRSCWRLRRSKQGRCWVPGVSLGLPGGKTLVRPKIWNSLWQNLLFLQVWLPIAWLHCSFLYTICVCGVSDREASACGEGQQFCLLGQLNVHSPGVVFQALEFVTGKCES